MSEERLKEIDELLIKGDDRDLLLERGQILAAMERFDESVDAYSLAIACDPFCSKAYLLRGRKYNSLMKYRKACADFTMATRFDTEESDNWYYFGVAYYMLREYLQAAEAFERCLKVTMKYRGDELPPIMDWCWMTYSIMGDRVNADRILSMVDEGMVCNPKLYYVEVYKRRLLLYKGVIEPRNFINMDELRNSDRPAVNYITAAYGLANYLYSTGEAEWSNELLKKIVAVDSYHYSFAYVLALRDLKDRGLIGKEDQNGCKEI